MAERYYPRPKTPIDERLGVEMQPTAQGLWVGERHYPSAVGLVGDGTGLEALKTARSRPDAAVFVIDPYANHFAGTLYTQLATPGFRAIDWAFISESPAIRQTYPTLAAVLNDVPVWRQQIEAEYGQFAGEMEAVGSRIYLVDGKTQTVTSPRPIFDEVRVTYPESRDIYAVEIPALFGFLNDTLRPGGDVHVATDIQEYYDKLVAFAYPYIVRHGQVRRSGQGLTVDPISLYDITNGADGYYYIDMKKKKPFPRMDIAEFAWQETFNAYGILGLLHGAYDWKKKDKK